MDEQAAKTAVAATVAARTGSAGRGREREVMWVVSGYLIDSSIFVMRSISVV